MKKLIYIYGAGGLGREIKAMLKNLNEWELVGFFDDNIPEGEYCESILCMGGIDKLKTVSSAIEILLAIGSPEVKLKIADSLKLNSCIFFPQLFHPSAQLLDVDRIKISPGCIISSGCTLTTNIEIGRHTLINLNTTIGHDTIIGEACSIMPGVNIAGNVTIGKGVLIGSGAVILNGLNIGDNARVGAGAVVTKNVEANSTVVGVPAKELKKT